MWFNDDGLAQIVLRDVVIFLILLAIVVDQDTAHTKVGDDRGMFLRQLPEHEVTGILQAEIACLVESFADISAFSDLTSCLVFLLLRCSNFAKAKLDIGRKL